jgi:hypothetical protein
MGNMTDSDSTPAISASSSRSGWLAALALGVSMVALGLAGFALERSLRAPDLPTPSAPDLAITKIDALRTRLRTLSDRFEALETKLAAEEDTKAAKQETPAMQGPMPPPVAPTVDVDALKAEIAEVKSQQEKALKDVQSTLAALETQIKDAQAEDVQAMRRLSYQMLRGELMQGRAYTESLARYRALAGAEAGLDPAFKALEDHAEKGIATKAMLYRELLALHSSAPELTEATPKKPAPKQEDFWGQTQAGLSSLVRIERLPDAASPIATLDEAQKTMALGDVARTRKLIESLPEPERVAYASWLEKVQTRERVLRALKRVSAPVFAPRIAPKAAGAANG